MANEKRSRLVTTGRVGESYPAHGREGMPPGYRDSTRRGAHPSAVPLHLPTGIGIHLLIGLILIALAWLVSACQMEVDVPLPDHESRLVVFGYLRAGEPIDIYVYRSQGTTDIAPDQVLEGATVVLFREGELVDTLHFTDTPIADTVAVRVVPGDTVYEVRTYRGAKYTTSPGLALPLAGESYSVRITHPGYPPVSAETRIQAEPVVSAERVALDSLSLRDLQGGNPRVWTALFPWVEDPQPDRHYYAFFLEVMYACETGSGASLTVDTLVDRRWSHTQIYRALEGHYYGETYPLPDSLLADGPFLCWLYVPGSACTAGGVPANRPPGRLRPLRMRMYTFVLSEAYGLYNQKLVVQANNRLEGLRGIFFRPEPVSAQGNVTGGYGMLGSYNLTVTELDTSLFR